MVRKIAWFGASLALVAALILGGLWANGRFAGPAEAQTPTAPVVDRSASETITVVGQGSVRIEPDIAQVSIGVETSAETVGDAVADNESRMRAIMEALESLGIDAADIQTMNYSIQLNRTEVPLPATEEQPEGKASYVVTNMANVIIRDLDTVGDVLDAVIEAGANSIWGVSFSLDDPKPAQDEARVEAIADAEARAAALAELTGVTLGPVMSVSEVTSAGIFPVMERAAVMGGGSISPGQVEIGYQVQVSYFIER